MRILKLWRPFVLFFLGITFFTSGMAKLYAGHQFPGWIGPVWLIEKLQTYQLGMYAAFIALSQVVTGFLLLTRRFWLLGAILLVPMLANILLITISQQWSGTPYVVAVLLLMNLALLASEYARLRVLWANVPYTPRPIKQAPHTLAGHLLWTLGLVVTIVAVLVSYQALSLSYGLVAGGLLLAWLSPLVDRRRVAAFLPPVAP